MGSRMEQLPFLCPKSAKKKGEGRFESKKYQYGAEGKQVEKSGQREICSVPDHGTSPVSDLSGPYGCHHIVHLYVQLHGF